MSTTEIKADLVRLIDQTEDGLLLQAIHTILARKVPVVQRVQWETLSEPEKEAVCEGLAQLDRGEGHPHAEVMARFLAKYAQ